MQIIIALAALLAAGPAFASDSTVTLPWGDWVAEIATWAGGILAAVIATYLARLVALLPAWAQGLLDAQRIARLEQLMQHAISAGINATAGAVRGRALSMDVGAKVVAEAVNYALANGPERIITFAGGAEGLRQKAIARLTLDENAALK